MSRIAQTPNPTAGTLAAGAALLLAACAPGGPPSSPTGQGTQPLIAAGAAPSEHAATRKSTPTAQRKRPVWWIRGAYGRSRPASSSCPPPVTGVSAT